MKLRTAIIISGTIPILIIFISSLLSQYVALIFTGNQLNIFANQMFSVQLMYVKLMMLSINIQLQQEVQKFALMVRTLSLFQSKVISGKVKQNSSYNPALVNLEMLYRNKADPYLTQLFLRDRYALNDWLHQNISVISDLPQEGKDYLRNSTITATLGRTYQYINDKYATQNPRYIQQGTLIEGYSGLGIFFSNGLNQTYSNSVLPNCTKGPYILDTRCAFWYKQGTQQPSIFMTPPQMSLIGQVHKMLTGICQQVKQYNSTAQADITYSVRCVPFYLSTISIFFENFINQTTQSYVIDPRTQSIFYNSLQQNYTQIQQFYQTELTTNRNQDQIQALNNTINQRFGKWVFKSETSSDLEDMMDTQLDQIIQIPYKKNDTQYQVIINPIFVYDKLPQFAGVHSDQPKAFNSDILLLQINFISEQNLKQEANKLLDTFNRYYLIVGCLLIAFFFVTLLVSFYYTYKLNRNLEIPLEHLTFILNKLLEEIQDDNLINIYNDFKNNNSNDIFLSKEMSLLFSSFDQIIQMLLYASEHFFNENETIVLLRLYRNIEFFKQFKNNHALGIIHNNIGSILLSKKHYFLSLEHYSLAALYAQYELEEFLNNNKNISISPAIQFFSINENSTSLQSSNFIPSNTISIPSKKVSDFQSKKLSTFYQFQNQRSTQNLDRRNNMNSFSFVRENNNKSINNIMNNDIKNKDDVEQVYEEAIMPQYNPQSNQQMLDISNQNLILSNQKLSEEADKVSHVKNYESSQLIINSTTTDKVNNIINTIFRQRQQLQEQVQQPSTTSLNISEQLNTIFLNVYYRKKNYAIALFSFQESYDKTISKKSNLREYNFWREVKQLLNELIIMINYIDIQDTEKIELLIHVSRCQLYLKNKAKAFAILKKCQNQAKVQNNSETYNRDHGTKTLYRNQQSQSYQGRTNSQKISIYTSTLNIENSKIGDNINHQVVENDQDKSNLKLIDSNNKCYDQESKIDYQRLQNSKRSSLYEQLKRTFLTIRHEQKSNKIKFPTLFSLQKNLDSKTTQSTKTSLSSQSKLESTFQMLRNQYRNEQQNVMKDETMQIINIGFVDYYMMTNQLYDSALLLTEMFEKNYALYSHLPFQMVKKLMTIFKHSNINISQIKKMRQNFNKNMALKVCYVIGNQQNNQIQKLESLRLISNLVNETLYKPEDEVGIMFYNHDDQYSQILMELIPIKIVKGNFQASVEQLYQFLFRNTQINDHDNLSQLTISRNHSFSYHSQMQHFEFNSKLQNRKTSALNNIMRTTPQEQFSEQTAINEKMIQKQQQEINKITHQIGIDGHNISFNQSSTQMIKKKPNNILNDKESSFNQNYTDHNNKNNISSFTKSSLYDNIQIPDKRLFNNHLEKKQNSRTITHLEGKHQNMEQSPHNHQFIQSDQNSNLTEKGEQLHIKNKHFYQGDIKSVEDISCNETLIPEFNDNVDEVDDDNNIDNDDDINQQLQGKAILSNINNLVWNLSSLSNSQFRGDEDNPLFESLINLNNEQQKNEMVFHLSIRKSIKQFISTKLLNKFDIINLSFSKQNRDHHKSKKNQYIFKNYIVYVTEPFLIKRNSLFTKMCQSLYHLDIMLLILFQSVSIKEPQNKETIEDMAFLFNDKEIINIFYSVEELQVYLNYQRGNITKYIYPTHIQHF